MVSFIIPSTDACTKGTPVGYPISCSDNLTIKLIVLNLHISETRLHILLKLVQFTLNKISLVKMIRVSVESHCI